MDNVRNMNDTESTSYKLIMLHINDSQVRMLEDFFCYDRYLLLYN
jgi:hypothetical protein